MALPTHLQHFMDEPIKVLNDGHVQLIDVMGDDNTIVQAARVSYGAGTKRVSKDRHLIRYLMRQRHTTPFEMCSITFRVRVPMDAWRQWIRHRTASVNEYSTRYSEAIDSTQQTDPTQWRTQAKDNKQGSSGFVTEFPNGDPTITIRSIDPQTGERTRYEASPGEYLSQEEVKLHNYARAVYDERLTFGIAREVARKDLPLSTYTEAYWKMDLHNLFHFLALRMDPHAQLEIREFANAIATVVKEWVPWAWEAFEDYRLKGMYLTRFEVEGLRNMLNIAAAYMMELQASETQLPAVLNAMGVDALRGSGLPDGREKTAFQAKLTKIMGN